MRHSAVAQRTCSQNFGVRAKILAFKPLPSESFLSAGGGENLLKKRNFWCGKNFAVKKAQL